MEWKKSPPIFSMETETVPDLANAALLCNKPALMNRLDYMANFFFREAPPTIQLLLAGLMRDPYLRRANAKPAAYVEFFVKRIPWDRLGTYPPAVPSTENLVPRPGQVFLSL